MRNIKMEEITKANDSLYFAQEEIRKAISNSDPVESLILFQILEKTISAKKDLESLLNAINAKDENN